MFIKNWQLIFLYSWSDGLGGRAFDHQSRKAEGGGGGGGGGQGAGHLPTEIDQGGCSRLKLTRTLS